MTLIATTAMHLTLCPILVFGAGPIPPLGVAGAAASTVACNALSAIGLLAWLSRRGRPVRVLGGHWALQLATVQQILRLALPSALSPILSNASIALTTAYVAGFGSLAVAAYGIGARLEYILVPIAFGFGGALTTMVATNLGADQAARAKRVTWIGAALVWAATGLIGLATALWPLAWMGVFTSDEEVKFAGALYLRIVGGAYGFFGLALALFFASQGAGRLTWPLIASTARLVVVAVGGWVAVRVIAGPPELLYMVVAASLVTMGVTVGAATYMSDWTSAQRRN